VYFWKERFEDTKVVIRCHKSKMVLNATFNNIKLNRGDQFYWWRKPEYPLKTTDLVSSH